ncbi:heparinase II/III domain-containing protein [Paenibacillus sp. FA6]|uniref:heparinase II/III domain-containing protein n=1 Tax=Paenibacillus sp. FA6 TaxID=3413029 RepID=UPI003F6585D6
MTTLSDSKEQLQLLVDRAEWLLSSRGEYFTYGAKVALMDVLGDAKLALQGRTRLPFKRTRRFYTPREDEAIQFATKRYTMAPTYNENGNVYHYYGLEPALAWFEKQDILYDGTAKLQDRVVFVIEKAQELLKNARFGKDIGCYDEATGDRLQSAVETVQKEASFSSTSTNLALAIVQCFNRVREFRYSRVLRTDVTQASSLYLTPERLEEVKRIAQTDVLIKEQYALIREIADSLSLVDIEKATSLMNMEIDYDQLNKELYIWSSTDKIVNFTAPENAVSATISFILPAEENEQDGLGHVWIDNLEIFSASGGSLDILNSGFDEGDLFPSYWKMEKRSGNPLLKWEDVYPYCGGGDLARAIPKSFSQMISQEKLELSRHSLYICNPTHQDEGSWTYDQEFTVESGMGYTLSFDAKIDGKFKRGLKVVISYINEDGQSAGEYVYRFNRKSSLVNSAFSLKMQCDAIQYAFTGDIAYAQKAKKEILYNLHDFCQGAEYWLVANERPDGSDSFGAVQGGRLLSSTAVTYSMIKEAGVFSSKEKRHFYDLVEYMLRYMMDLRDRTELSPLEAQSGCSNWQTDMCAGTGYMMMVLDDFPNRKAWLYNANMVLHSQLVMNVNPDNSWPESIRYHHAALERFAGYAKVLSHVMGENWFETTALAQMFGYSIDVQTPGYRYFDGRVGTPPFGDHMLTGGSEFGSYGTYIEDVERIDKSLANRMTHCWILAGQPFKKLWGEGVALENLLGKGYIAEPTGQFTLDSTKDYPHAGIYVFRKKFNSIGHSYFAVMSSPEPIAHGHLDQGSFIIYKNSVPIVMDSGIEGYFDNSTSWHISSYSHACLQFSTRRTNIEKTGNGVINLSAGTYSLERGWVDVPKTSNVIDCTLGKEMDSITIEILNPEGGGKHTRQIYYIKDPDLYIIRDTVEDFEGEVLFNLPVASTTSSVSASRVFSTGVYDVNLETVFLSKVNRIELEKGRSTPFFKTEQSSYCTMDYIRARADAKEGFLALLYPCENDRRRLEVTSEANGRSVVTMEDSKVEIRIQDNRLHVNVLSK